MSDAILTKIENDILTITINRPDALNALRPDMLEDLRDAVSSATTSGAKAVIIEGEGRAFSAGVDLKALKGMKPENGKVGDVLDNPSFEFGKAVRDCSVPVIAKVHGFCFTGALEIALHCDFIYTTTTTKFGDTHVKFGLRPTWGMSQNLPRAVGIRRARELSFTARTFTGVEAAAWGLANEAVEDKDALDALVEKRASEIAANSTEAVAAFKALYRISQSTHPIEEALESERATSFENFSDTAERLGDFG